jgi:hypothetical protein
MGRILSEAKSTFKISGKTQQFSFAGKNLGGGAANDNFVNGCDIRCYKCEIPTAKNFVPEITNLHSMNEAADHLTITF